MFAWSDIILSGGKGYSRRGRAVAAEKEGHGGFVPRGEKKSSKGEIPAETIIPSRGKPLP